MKPMEFEPMLADGRGLSLGPQCRPLVSAGDVGSCVAGLIPPFTGEIIWGRQFASRQLLTISSLDEEIARDASRWTRY